MGPVLTCLLYAYVQPGNYAHAKKMGEDKKWGSASAFINALIAKSRGASIPTRPLRGQEGFKQNRSSPTNKPRGPHSKKKPEGDPERLYTETEKLEAHRAVLAAIDAPSVPSPEAIPPQEEKSAEGAPEVVPKPGVTPRSLAV